MAVLAITSTAVAGVATATINTAGASDTFTYEQGTGMFLELHNTTGGSLTAVIKNTPSATYPISGTGTTTDLSAGLSVVVAAGAKKVVHLDKISAYLSPLTNGTSTVTVSGAATLSITIFK